MTFTIPCAVSPCNQVMIPGLTAEQMRTLAADLNKAVAAEFAPALRHVWSTQLEIDVGDAGDLPASGIQALLNQQLTIANQSAWRAGKDPIVLINGSNGLLSELDPASLCLWRIIEGEIVCTYSFALGFESSSGITPWTIAISGEPGKTVPVEFSLTWANPI